MLLVVKPNPSMFDECKLMAQEFLAVGQTFDGLCNPLDCTTWQDWFKEMKTAPGVNNEFYITIAPESGVIVGAFKLQDLSIEEMLGGSWNYSHCIRPHFQGKGYGSLQMCLALVEFSRRGQKYMVSGVDSKNVSSIRVMTSLGAKYVANFQGHQVWAMSVQ